MSRWKDATVLVTGGTGFLGRHLVGQLLATLDVHAVRIYSRDEHKQHALRQHGGIWSDTAPGSRITYIVGDVRDGARLTRACRGVDILVHAAALKRVEGSATHARELLKTNALGTANVIDAALDNQVPYTLFVSSDKAALATNCYGKTKAIAEDLIVEGNGLSGGRQRFSSVRYGNVLGSTGSVLSIWEHQRLTHQPLTVTSVQMTRFWYPVQDAVAWIVASVDAMQGGEILCPKMLRGYLMTLLQVLYPGEHPLVQETEERPGGEKYAETLVGGDEVRHTTETPSGYIIHPQQTPWNLNYSYMGAGEPLAGPVTSGDEPLATTEQLRALLVRAGLPVGSAA